MDNDDDVVVDVGDHDDQDDDPGDSVEFGFSFSEVK